jgi:hypothetical protein
MKISAHVEAVVEADRALVERHGRGEDLEDRAHFVDAEARPVEARVARRGTGRLRIEAGQGDHGDDLAAAGIEHQPGCADRLELRHGRGELLGHDVLDTQVEAELNRIGTAAQGLLEGLLDAGQALVVDIGEAHDMGGERAVRIDPFLLALEVEARDAETVDPILFARRQLAFQPDEGTLGGELHRGGAGRELRQNGGQPIGDQRWIADLPGIGVERGGRQGRGEHGAVTVDNIGPYRGMLAGPRRLGQAWLLARSQQAEAE